MPARSRRVQLHCNSCGQPTNHTVLKTHDSEGKEPLTTEDMSITISWKHTWRFVQCCGCNDISVEKTVWLSETAETLTEYFPPRAIRHVPTWADQLPDGVTEVLQEVYVAINSNNRRLATMGARCLIDLVVLDMVGDVGTFQEKMEAMQTEGLLGAENRKHLEAALDIGSAAAHRGHRPSPEALSLVMDIVENFLQAAYILKGAGQEIVAETPPRLPRAKSKGK